MRNTSACGIGSRWIGTRKTKSDDKGGNIVAFNISITNIRTRNPFLLWLLRTAAKLCGAEMRTWRSRPRREKKEEAPDA